MVRALLHTVQPLCEMPLQRPRRDGAAAKANAKAKAKVAAKAASAKAEAQARARFRRANTRRQHRRLALADLNSLAGECGLLSAQVAVKAVTPAEVKQLVRRLEAR